MTEYDPYATARDLAELFAHPEDSAAAAALAEQEHWEEDPAYWDLYFDNEPFLLEDDLSGSDADEDRFIDYMYGE